MLRLLLIAMITLTSCGNFPKIQNQDFSKNVSISLEIKKCIPLYKIDTVTYIINNDNDFGFWLHSWALEIDSIITKNGLNVSSKSLIDYKAPKVLKKYIWINANSKLKIYCDTEFFLDASLEKLTEYYVYASYHDGIRKRHSKEITFTQQKQIERINLWVCP